MLPTFAHWSSVFFRLTLSPHLGLGLTVSDLRGVLFYSFSVIKNVIAFPKTKKKKTKTTKTNQNKKNPPWYLSKTTHYRVKRSELLFWWMLLHSTFYSKCLNWWTLLVNTEWIEVPYAEDIKCRNKVLLLSKPSEFLENSKLI